MLKWWLKSVRLDAEMGLKMGAVKGLNWWVLGAKTGA